MKNIIQLVIAITIGLFVGYLGWQLMQAMGCNNGSSISETPNYCMGGRL